MSQYRNVRNIPDCGWLQNIVLVESLNHVLFAS